MTHLTDFIKYGIFLSCAMVLSSCAAVAEESLPVTQAAAASTAPHGLYVNSQGQLMHAGMPFRGIGVNYFDAFSRNNNTCHRSSHLLEQESQRIVDQGCNIRPYANGHVDFPRL